MPRAIATRPPGTRPGHSPHWSRPCRRRADHRSATTTARRRAAPAFGAGGWSRIHAAGATSLFTHKVLPLLSAADLGRFEATAPARRAPPCALQRPRPLRLVAWRRLAEPRRRAAVAPGAALRLLHADTERCTLVVLSGAERASPTRRRPRRSTSPPSAARRPSRGAPRRWPSVRVSSSRGDRSSTRRDRGRRGAGRRRRDGRRVHRRVRGRGRGAATRTASTSRRATPRAFGSRSARSTPRSRAARPSSATSSRRSRARRSAPTRWVLRAVDGRACWTPGCPRERVAVAAAAGAATVRVDLERAYDRRDIVLPLSTEARSPSFWRASLRARTRARTRRSSRRRPRSGAARSA